MAFAEDLLISQGNHEGLNKIETLEDSNSSEFINYIEDIVQQVDRLGIADESATIGLSGKVSEVLEKINNLKSQNEETYRTIIRSQQYQELIDGEYVVDYADNILKNLKYCKDNLEVPFKEISDLEKMLRFLKRFFEFITSLGIQSEKLQDLLIHILSVVDTAAFISYRCFRSGGEANVVNMIKDCMAKAMFIDSEVIDSLLKSLKSSRASEFDVMVEIAKGIVDFLQNVLKVTLNRGANVNEQVKDDEIQIFHRGLESLKSFLSNKSSQYIEHVKSILSHVEVVFTEHTPKLFSIGELAYLFELSKDLKLIKAEVCILEHLNSTMESPIKDQIETLLEGLVFMRNYFMSHKMKHISCLEFSLYKQIEVAFNGESIISSLFDSGVEEDSLQRMLEDIKLLKIQASKIYRESTRLNFPRINQTAFLDSFLEYLKKDLIPTSNRIALVKQQVMALHSSLELLSTLFCCEIEQYNEHKEFKEIKNRVVDAAFEAEYTIDSYFVREHPLWYHILALFHVTEKIELIKSEVTEIFNKNLEARVKNTQEMNIHVLSEVNFASNNEDKIVGVEDKVKNIVGELTKGTKEHHVISIVGMAKLGKTVLAKAVYNDGTVLKRFDVRAWCDLSRVNTERELLLELLSQVATMSDQISKSDDDGDLALLLKKSLCGRRYLIVMDDLRDIKAWDYFQRAFPKNKNGSGIIFTTRFHCLVSKLNHQTRTFPLGFLTTRRSWELLKNKIFEEDCPGELEEIGMRIAKGCYGLPYAIGLTAKILGEMEKNPDSWEEAEERIRSSNIAYLNEYILEPSYKHLPEHLKSCFVYWGPIVKNKTIPIKKLIWLSIAERLVQEPPNKSLEDQAEDFLLELLGTSMVLVAQQRSIGRIKNCCIADQFCEFCLDKCREENIWELINGNDEDTKSKQEPYTQCRLYVHSNGRHFIMSKPSGSHVRSLIFGVEDEFRIMDCDVPCITNNFRLLRVLDFGSINVGHSFPQEIELMILLRYLAIQGDFDSVPESISNLSDLETFLIKGSKAVGLPHTMRHMRKLRHLHIYPHVVFLPGLYYHGQKSLMSPMESNLQTISALPLVYAVDSTWTEEDRIKEWLANVRNLRCVLVDDSSSPSKKRNLFPFLLYLDKLESLKICRSHGVVSSSDFSFPSSLKRLTLSNLELRWDEISIIGRLPYLEVLKLLCNAFKGSEWNMKDGEFLRLKFLKLDSSNIRLWTGAEDCLPCLERLVLQRCEQLDKVPPCITYNTSLQTIEVLGCNDSIIKLVKGINVERGNFGYPELKGLH